MIRQPIISVLGHVDHGKTSLLDRIRRTAVAAGEAGGITQAVGATEVPIATIKEISGKLLEKFKINVDIPGLLFIDTPGHAAFTSLRERGSSIADLAILVVDIKQGIQEQTLESIEFLKQFKTPFMIAATKLDLINGWISHETLSFYDSLERQPSFVKDELDKQLYKLVGQLSEKGFESERFDRVSDFQKTIAIIPCSGMTGEGIAELLVILSGLAQQFLSSELSITSEIGRGSILEVKEVKGLGMTVDIILYDGMMKKGDLLVIGGPEPISTKVRAILKPQALKELRVEKQFDAVDTVTAAAGVKVSAPNLEGAKAGVPIICIRSNGDVESAKKELIASASKIEFEGVSDGVVLVADTLGSLEAMLHIFKNKEVSVKSAKVGRVLHRELIEAEKVNDISKRFIIAFNISVDEGIEKEAKDRGVRLLKGDVIYRIIEEFDRVSEELREHARKKRLDSITRPGVIKILPGFVFHASDPAIVGVEVLEGSIKSGYKLMKKGKEIGVIKAIQKENSPVESAYKGERVAVSIEGPTVGRQIHEKDELETVITKTDIKILAELGTSEETEIAKRLLENLKTE